MTKPIWVRGRGRAPCSVRGRQIGIPTFLITVALAGWPTQSDGAGSPTPFDGMVRVASAPSADATVAERPMPVLWQEAPPDAPVAPPPMVPTLPVTPDQTAPPASTDRDNVPGQESDLIVTGRSRRGDPLEPVNAASFDATQAVDRAIVGPMARAYQKVLPTPVRDGVRNFLGNLREPIVFINYLLQLKPGKAAETLGRFTLNTTVGAAGLVDVAKRKPFRLPRRRNSFANTLGLYGVKPGPFFFLPLIGPTTLRDLIGSGVDQIMVPVSSVPPLNDPQVALSVGVLSALSYRAQFDDTLTKIRASPDPYAASRRYYLDRRQAEIDGLRGRRGTRPVAPASPPTALETAPAPIADVATPPIVQPAEPATVDSPMLATHQERRSDHAAN